MLNLKIVKQNQMEINNCGKAQIQLIKYYQHVKFDHLTMQLSKTVLVDSSAVSTNLSIGSCEDPYISHLDH